MLRPIYTAGVTIVTSWAHACNRSRPGNREPVRRLILLLALFAVTATPTAATAKQGSKFQPAVQSPYGIVATESPAASQVGRDVLEHGGNAVDAAAATVFAINVARPQSCGIGGGGFAVYRQGNRRTPGIRLPRTPPPGLPPPAPPGPRL